MPVNLFAAVFQGSERLEANELRYSGLNQIGHAGHPLCRACEREESRIMARNRVSRGTAGILAAIILVLAAAVLKQSSLRAQNSSFHGAPASADSSKNPYAGKADAALAGANLFAKRCASCHGVNGQGTGNIPALAKGAAQTAPDGAIFWFITQGIRAMGCRRGPICRRSSAGK